MSNKHWLASYGERIPAEINADAYRSVLEMFEQAMQRFAEKPAIRCFDQTLTYADTDRLSRNFTAYLQSKLGVAKGDRIAVMLPNIPAFALAMLGIVRAGAVQLNVNPLYSPRELEHQLNDAGVETIVIFSGSSSTLADIITDTRVKNVVTVNLGDGTGASLTSPPVDSRLKNCFAFSDAVAQGANLPFKSVPVGGEDLLFLQYTGGTTGVSKGAALSHRNLVANTEQFKAFIPDALRPGQEVVVTALPLYHIFALMVNFISCYSIGAENWLVPNPRDMDSFVETLGKARPTIFTGVNTLFGGLLMNPKIADVDFSSLRVAIGGAGEICAKGPQVMSGYWQRPEANAVAFTPDGYFRTGDVGVFDERGFLKIVDRKKDMIIVSGFNVYPNEVEAVAAACTGVAECACVGKADEKTGEAVRLFVSRAPGATLTEADLLTHCRRELAAYKVPKEIRFLEALPKSNVGKILRKDLRTFA